MRPFIAAVLGFGVAFLFGFTSTQPARHATPFTTTAANIYIHDPYVTNFYGNVTGKAPPVNCGPTQAIGMYDDGGSIGINCITVPSSGSGGSPGGLNSQVQFNDAGAFGGITKVESDGTHLRYVSETTHPAWTDAGTALTYDFQPNTNVPALPMRLDNFLGIPIPEGLLSVFSVVGTDAGAQWNYAYTNVTRVPSTLGCVGAGATCAVAASLGTNVPWANTNAFTRTFWIQSNGIGTAANTSSSMAEGVFRAHYDTTAGAGGFIFKTRVELTTTSVHLRCAFGLFNTTGSLLSTANPNAQTDSIYIGCNDGDANLSICSNDNSGTATCSTLGASYPCQTNGAWYDIWFAAPPGGAPGGGIYWFIERFDTPASTGGLVTSDLPRTSVQLAWQDWVNTGGTAGATVAIKFSEGRLLFNY